MPSAELISKNLGGDEFDNEFMENIYRRIYDNYDNIISNEHIAKILDVNANSICKKFKNYNPELTDRDIQCRSFTILYFSYLLLLVNNDLKE